MTPGRGLRSGRGRRPQPERLAHPAVLGADGSEPNAAARRRTACARHRLLRALPAARTAAGDSDRAPDPCDERPAALLSGRTRRPRWPRLRDAEVPDAAPRRRGPAGSVPRRGARSPHEGGEDGDRRVAARDAAGRDPTAAERVARRHEPRRAAPDPAAVLRGARGRAARVLATARHQAGADRLRAGASRLRDVDGREARARPGMDRGPLCAALPAHTRDDGAARLAPVRARAVPARTRLDVESRVLEIEVPANAVGDVAADRAVAT